MRFKIVAATLVLLLLMALPALHALRLAAATAAVAAGIAEDHAAAVAAVADGTRALVIRHVLVQRQLAPAPDGAVPPSALADADADADGHFAAALLLLRQAAGEATDPRDARDLGRLTLLFELAMDERRRLAAEGDSLLAADERPAARRAALDDAQDRLIARLDQVKDGLRQVMERQAQEMREAVAQGRRAGLALFALAAVLGLAGALELGRRAAARPLP